MKAFLIIFCGLATVSAVDYCSIPCKQYVSSPEKCKGRLIGQSKCEIPHVRCGNTGFKPSCNEPMKIELDDNAKKLFVELHNQKRNLTAGGANIMRACRMGTMQWDDNLAESAAAKNNDCLFAHDYCHNDDVYHYSGQNIFRNFSINDFVPLELDEQIEHAVDGWYNEGVYVNNAVLRGFYLDPNVVYGHFTVMVVDSNTRVGCAIIYHYTETVMYDQTLPQRNILITCNYAKTNMIGIPVFQPCNEAASGCTKINDRFKNLCSVEEEYDFNEYKKLGE